MSESKVRRIYFCLKANFSGKKIEAETWNERQPSSQRKRQSHNFQTENFTPTTEKKKEKRKKLTLIAITIIIQQTKKKQNNILQRESEKQKWPWLWLFAGSHLPSTNPLVLSSMAPPSTTWSVCFASFIFIPFSLDFQMVHSVLFALFVFFFSFCIPFLFAVIFAK